MSVINVMVLKHTHRRTRRGLLLDEKWVRLFWVRALMAEDGLVLDVDKYL